MSRNPFTAGRWVSGSQFFGRTSLIDELLQTNEPCNWVIGKRRMGKTSLLRELERRINSTDTTRLALFWDLQGSFDGSGLFDSLYDAVEDSQDGYEESWEGIEFDPAEEDSCSQLLKKLTRILHRQSRSLVLLMDEPEELMSVGKHNPGIISKLRRFLQTNRHTQTIMVSSPRLELLGQTVEMETSPFLHGFIAYYLGNFKTDPCERLLRQGIDNPEIMARIHRITGGNPFEVQLVAKHYFEDQSLDQALVQLETNPTLNQTTEVNFNLLTEEEQQLLKAAHCGPAPFQEFDQAITAKLLRMGYLKEEGGGFQISSHFQARWLSNNLMTESEAPSAKPQEVLSGVVLSVNHKSTILQQVVSIYRIFLELAQNGRRPIHKDGVFILSEEETIVLDRKSLQLEPLQTEGDHKPWWTAIEETAAFLDQYLDRQESWPVFRFHQMAEKGPGHYAEKEFLDLMMLIAEEAVLG